MINSLFYFTSFRYSSSNSKNKLIKSDLVKLMAKNQGLCNYNYQCDKEEIFTENFFALSALIILVLMA